jgi:predicted ATP-dependent endonuclease of OLD family
MKIKTIEIENWRSIKNMTISAQDLMIIIGQNNHGKSNLLSALLFFFGEIKHQNLDFFQKTNELFVDIEFSDLDEQDNTTFQKYITKQGTIKVRKIAYLDGSFEYKGWVQNCTEDYLKEENAVNYTKRETASCLPFYSDLPATGKLSKQQIIEAQQNYIQKNITNLTFNYELESTHFMGLKSVAKGIFGEVYFLPALKNAAEDFTSKDTSIFSKLLGEVIETMSINNADWQETKQQLNKVFSKFNKYINGIENAGRPKQLSDLEKELSKELQSWNAYFDIELNTPDIDSVLKSNASVWIDDGTRTDITRKGHGLQRAVTLALIQLIAKRQLQSTSDSETTTRKISKSRYFIFEEPELYLHPQAQRVLFDSFVDLSNTGSQVILCTHSSNLINIDKYKSIYIVRKENDQTGSTITQCEDDLFDGSERENWNLSYWINPDRGELFFAEKVILVEGPTEKTIIPALAKQLNVFRHDYTIIDCGSKDSIPLYLKLLNKFGIKYIAVYDQDHQHNKNQDAKNTATISTNKILNLIENKFGQSVAFINDIEEELGYPSGNSGKPFKALQYIKSDTFNLLNPLKGKIIKIYQ